jgi:hypothetical protein
MLSTPCDAVDKTPSFRSLVKCSKGYHDVTRQVFFRVFVFLCWCFLVALLDAIDDGWYRGFDSDVSCLWWTFLGMSGYRRDDGFPSSLLAQGSDISW